MKPSEEEQPATAWSIVQLMGLSDSNAQVTIRKPDGNLETAKLIAWKKLDRGKEYITTRSSQGLVQSKLIPHDDVSSCLAYSNNIDILTRLPAKRRRPALTLVIMHYVFEFVGRLRFPTIPTSFLRPRDKRTCAMPTPRLLGTVSLLEARARLCDCASSAC